jgi:hypothetical protein
MLEVMVLVVCRCVCRKMVEFMLLGAVDKA